MPLNRARSRRPRAAAIAAAALLGFAATTAAAATPTKDQCIDANETSQTLRKAEKLLEAEQRLLTCVSASCPGPVRDDCAQRLTEDRAAIPTIVFAVKDEADQDLTAVTVTMDGAPLLDKLDGTAIPLDPGSHHFVFEAVGRNKEERDLLLREGEKDRHERIVLAPIGASVPAPGGAAPAAAVTPEQPAPAHSGTTQRIAGLAVGGAGAVAVVVGIVLGFVSDSTYKNALDNECGGNPNGCSPGGVNDGKSAHGQAAASTVLFIAGGALLGGGAALYFTAPKESAVAVTPTVGDRSAGIGVAGRW